MKFSTARFYRMENDVKATPLNGGEKVILVKGHQYQCLGDDSEGPRFDFDFQTVIVSPNDANESNFTVVT